MPRIRSCILVPVLSLLLASFLVAACGGDEPTLAPPEETVSSDPAPEATEQAQPREPAPPTPTEEPEPTSEDAGSASVAVSPVDASEALLLPASLRAADEFGWSGDISGDWMVISAPFHDQNGPQSGAAWVYKRSGEVWAEHQQLLAADGEQNDWFARWVAIDGDTLIVTAPFADLSNELTDAGAVYVFELDGAVWRQTAKLTGSPPQDGQLFGWHAAMQEDVIVVGATGDTAGLGGVAYVFRRHSGRWAQEALLQPETSTADDDFGFAVAVDGNTVVVGAPSVRGTEPDDRDGEAFLFQPGPAGWQQVARLTAAPAFVGAEFGSAIAIEDDVIAIGAFHARTRGEDAGAVYLFNRGPQPWAVGGPERSADSMLIAEDTVDIDWFGYSIAIHNDTMVVGAPRRDHPTLPLIGIGAAYVFSRSGDAWTQVDLLLPDDAQTSGDDAGFAWDVWLDDEYIGSGSWLADNAAGVDAGSAYIYRSAGPLPDGRAIAAPSEAIAPSSTAAPVPVELIATLGGVGFDAPVDLAWLPDGRALVAEQEGRLLVAAPDGSSVTTALDLAGVVQNDSFEQGLLSIQPDPAFDSNGYVWIFYTVQPDGATRLSRVRLHGSQVDPESELVILEVEQPYSNHNGGAVRFGPDGMLYLGLGDGGSGGDPEGHGQNLATLLGTVLRLDVSQSTPGSPYRIPADNPFVDEPGARGEIWAYGLRNPWRMAFDAATGLLWLGDVGQDAFEEVNVLIKGGNYGWAVTEGVECFDEDNCFADADELPITIYAHEGDVCSITGGEVYRGGRIPGLAGAYVFGDFCSGDIWGLDAAGTGDPFLLLSTDLSIVSFAVDRQGGLYVLAPDWPIQQIVPVENPASAIPPGYGTRARN